LLASRANAAPASVPENESQPHAADV